MERPTFFSAIDDSRVNRDAGVIEGVSVITCGRAIGHGSYIDDTTLSMVKASAEEYRDGVRVKMDHDTGFDSIVGVLKNFRIAGEKLLADLHLLKNHDKREQILEVAQTFPASVGLSIAGNAAYEEIDGKKYARVSEIYSVDFVDRPAANPSGLFRSVDSPQDGMAAANNEKTVLEQIKSLLGLSATPEPINFEAKSKELEGKLTQLSAEVATKDAQILELSAAKTKAEADSEKVKTDFAAKEANLTLEIEKQASLKAAAITAILGIPPAPSSPPAPTGAKNFEALLAEYRAANPTASKSQAIQFCIKQHPAQYLECKNDPARISKL